MGVDNNATFNAGFLMRGLILHMLGAFLTLCAQAQTVYKWTDANGQVHYSEKKDGAVAKPQEVKIAPSPPAPAPPPPKASGPDPWEVAFQKPKPSQERPRPVPQPSRRSLSGGREDGSDASRCNLARDVLNGVLRHGNGAPIDQYDRDVAAADVKRFCR